MSAETPIPTVEDAFAIAIAKRWKWSTAVGTSSSGPLQREPTMDPVRYLALTDLAANLGETALTVDR